LSSKIPNSADSTLRAGHRSPFVLFVLVVLFAVCNITAAYLPYDALSHDATGTLYMIIWTLLVFQVLAFSLWTVLGTGAFVVRLVVVLPTLYMLLVSSALLTGYFADQRWFEFLAAALSWFTIFALGVILFLVFRKFGRFRIRLKRPASSASTANIKFSLKHLLALFTLYALAFGLTLQLRFSNRPSFLFSSADLFILALYSSLVMGAVTVALILPTVAIPLAILYGKPTRGAVVITLVLWFIATTPFACYLLVTSSGQSLTPDQPLQLSEICLLLFIPQATAALAGILSAIPLRFTGYRLVRLTKVTNRQAMDAGPTA
jgi:hypothetical protein